MTVLVLCKANLFILNKTGKKE